MGKVSPVANTSLPDFFYRAFEDKYRGSRELIKQRLRVYLPFISPLAGLYPALAVLDVGCGRGEWLELLQDHHIPAQGVDTDEGMLAACHERGLSVIHQDGIEHLKTLASHSLLAVTGFHIAEHLPFAVLQAFLVQAQRVLAPGGFLILETPNPENLLVGAANFYIDPTHQQPLPSQLLSFLAEYQGFTPVKVLRLQEEARLPGNGPVSLYDVLANVSPDYAIVAQAPYDLSATTLHPALVEQLAQALVVDTGVSLVNLADRYDQHLQQHGNAQRQAVLVAQHQAKEALAQTFQLNTHIQQLGKHAEKVDNDMQQLDAQAAQINTNVQQLGERINTDVQQLSSSVQQLTAQVQELASHLAAVYASRSWRVTRPLRWLARQFRSGTGRD